MTVRDAGAGQPASRDAFATTNGPEGGDVDWQSINWRSVDDDVRRLRQRIFTASQAGDLNRVRNLQKLMLRSRANALQGVRRVTEVNAGRSTAGVDGQVVVTAQDKAQLAIWAQRPPVSWTPRPARRVYIPRKGTTKQRGLGIPVIADRCLQAVTLNALEPEWEARFEPKSYGFRPGRGCHDAIGAIYATLKGKNPSRVWILDADLTAAFDRIDHQHLLITVGTFPARDRIRGWLQAGVVERGRFAPTEEGTPQGGVISPLLFNVALHGLETAAGVHYLGSGDRAGRVREGSPTLVRFADDFVVMCDSRDQAETVLARLRAWLAVRGLALNEDKTSIVHADTGFDFLGFNVRRYHGKLLIKPSKAAIRRLRERLRLTFRSLRGGNAAAILRALNPLVRGWAAYYRTVVSSKVFDALDNYVWRLAYKWATRGHSNKSKHWVIARYFGRFNKTRQDRWVFGDRRSGAYLLKFVWTKIVRHPLVSGRASPDNPTLTGYWADRRRKGPPLPVDRTTLRLLQTQEGRCPLCRGLLLPVDPPPHSPQDWERWLGTTRKAISSQLIRYRADRASDGLRHRLTHVDCQRRRHIADIWQPAASARR